MKKSVLLLSLILSLIGTAQNQSTITINSVSPDTVYAGDTITIFFSFKKPGPGTVIQDQWYINSKAQGQISGISYTDYYSLPKEFIGTDTIYQLKIKTLTTHGIGAGSVKAHNSNVVPFFFCCNLTGIEEYRADTLAPIYFDLIGNRISPRHNEIMIEQRGVIRRKIIIQN